jgi:YD repeat-containing protein
LGVNDNFFPDNSGAWSATVTINPAINPVQPIGIGATGTNNPQGTASEPVSTGNGNYFYQTTDFNIPGRGLQVLFQRTYNTQDSYAGPLGTNWTHSYNILLTDESPAISIKWGDGHTDTYALTDSLYVPPPGVYNTLVKNPDGTYALTQPNQAQYNFTATGTLLSIVDKNGNSLVFAYDGHGNLIQITDTVGRHITLSYDSSNRTTQISDPVGRTVAFTYSSSNDLTTATDPLKGVTTFAYDTSHRITSITLPGGVALLTNTYDSASRVIAQTNGRGFLTTFAYNTPNADQTTITDPLGNATVHTYDNALRLVQITDALAGTMAYSYDSINDVTTTTNQNGYSTTYTYGANGNVLSITEPLNLRTSRPSVTTLTTTH